MALIIKSTMDVKGIRDVKDLCEHVDSFPYCIRLRVETRGGLGAPLCGVLAIRFRDLDVLHDRFRQFAVHRDHLRTADDAGA